MAKPIQRMRARARLRRERGVTLTELAIVFSIVGVLVAIAVPNTIRWQRDQRVKGAAHDVADLLLLARSEAARTGDRHIVIYGPPGTQDHAGYGDHGSERLGAIPRAGRRRRRRASNCKIDAGEARSVIDPVKDVRWGVALATVRAPGDTGAADFCAAAPGERRHHRDARERSGSIMPCSARTACRCASREPSAPAGRPAPPRSAARRSLPFTNGTRDYAVVLSPMGGVRVHRWNSAAEAWTL